MKYIREGNLDVHDRRRFNELRADVSADALVDKEFDEIIEMIRVVRIVNRGVEIDSRTVRMTKKRRAR